MRACSEGTSIHFVVVVVVVGVWDILLKLDVICNKFIKLVRLHIKWTDRLTGGTDGLTD